MSNIDPEKTSITNHTGRPKKSDYELVVNISRKLRNKYIAGSSRSLRLTNAPWSEDEFMTLVERAATKAAGGSIPSKATTRVVAL
jgi:hypothetical protein